MALRGGLGWLAALLAWHGGPAAEHFPREVDEGTTLRRTFEAESTLELEELELWLDGEPHPAGEQMGSEIHRASRIVVEDDFGPPAAGRPRRLVRYFEELGEESVRSVTGPDGSTEELRSSGSELEGRSVLFALGFDEGDHEVSWEAHPGEDELLERLVEDMDLRAFLPADGDVEPGQAWEVPAGAYLLLAHPGGVALTSADDDEADRRVSAELRDNLSGEIRAVYRGRREVDGLEVAVVALEMALFSEASTPIPTDDDVSVQVAVRHSHELEGELSWDPAGGHLHALELRGRSELEERTTIVSGRHENEQRARYGGPLELTARVERSE